MLNEKENAIEVKGLYKTFKLPHEQHSGIKQKIVNVFKGIKGYDIQKVLTDISFDVKKGEFLGIVGRNGSGKSTLLKLLAGIYTPDKGSIEMTGSLTPFIELGVGFNPELTGHENIYLNGALLGFSRQEVQLMYDDIVGFAELEKFMDQKLKNYSSGMQVRLAFSIAIRAKSDILILDEVLAVGDEAFQKKCTEYFIKMKKEKQTIILVTHDMGNVERFCDRVLVLDNSKMIGIFNTHKGKRIYNQLNRSNNQTESSSVVKNRWGSEKAKVAKIQINGSDEKRPIVSQGKPLEILITFEKKEAVPIIVGLGFYDESDTYVSGPNSLGKGLISSKAVKYYVAKNPLNPGIYRVELAVFDDSNIEEYDHMINSIQFEVINTQDDNRFGKVELFGEWE